MCLLLLLLQHWCTNTSGPHSSTCPLWPSGTFGIMWYCFWLLVSYESPAAHPTITEEERKYIEESIGDSAQQSITVWNTIFTCSPGDTDASRLSGSPPHDCLWQVASTLITVRTKKWKLKAEPNLLMLEKEPVTDCSGFLRTLFCCRNSTRHGGPSLRPCQFTPSSWLISAEAGLSICFSSASLRTLRRCLASRLAR